MVSWFGKKSSVRKVRGGESVERKCPECGETTTFKACVSSERWVAYKVINLWESEEAGFQCQSCKAVMDLADTLEPALSRRDAAKQAKAQARQRLADQRELEAQAKRAAEEAQAKREAEELAIDNELAAMKKNLGLDKPKS